MKYWVLLVIMPNAHIYLYFLLGLLHCSFTQTNFFDVDSVQRVRNRLVTMQEEVVV